MTCPNNPAEWRLPDRRRLEKLGVRILPGVQTVKLELAERLVDLLETLRL
ncbi:MAG: hypothetical protein GU356_11945 [Pyrobaculum sp.]|jgi:hypothetical protein|nr:hypothetical protein [Pyrobaculum sp.]